MAAFHLDYGYVYIRQRQRLSSTIGPDYGEVRNTHDLHGGADRGGLLASRPRGTV
jgi:hypothetical protein